MKRAVIWIPLFSRPASEAGQEPIGRWQGVRRRAEGKGMDQGAKEARERVKGVGVRAGRRQLKSVGLEVPKASECATQGEGEYAGWLWLSEVPRRGRLTGTEGWLQGSFFETRGGEGYRRWVKAGAGRGGTVGFLLGERRDELDERRLGVGLAHADDDDEAAGGRGQEWSSAAESARDERGGVRECQGAGEERRAGDGRDPAVHHGGLQGASEERAEGGQSTTRRAAASRRSAKGGKGTNAADVDGLIDALLSSLEGGEVSHTALDGRARVDVGRRAYLGLLGKHGWCAGKGGGGRGRARQGARGRQRRRPSRPAGCIPAGFATFDADRRPSLRAAA